MKELVRAGRGKRSVDALYARLDAANIYFRRHSDEARVMYILWFESVGAPSDMNTDLSRFHDEARSDIAGLVREAQERGDVSLDLDPGVFASQFCGLLFGLTYQWIVNPTSADVAAAMDGLRTTISKIVSRN